MHGMNYFNAHLYSKWLSLFQKKFLLCLCQHSISPNLDNPKSAKWSCLWEKWKSSPQMSSNRISSFLQREGRIWERLHKNSRHRYNLWHHSSGRLIKSKVLFHQSTQILLGKSQSGWNLRTIRVRQSQSHFWRAKIIINGVCTALSLGFDSAFAFVALILLAGRQKRSVT